MVTIRVYAEDAKLLKVTAAGVDSTIPEVLHAILVHRSPDILERIRAYHTLVTKGAPPDDEGGP